MAQVVVTLNPQPGVCECYPKQACALRLLAGDDFEPCRKEGFSEVFLEGMAGRSTQGDREDGAHQELEVRLLECTAQLEEARRQLREINDTVRALLQHRDQQKKEIQEAILSNVRNLLMPSLEKIRRSELNDEQKDDLCMLVSQLDEITSPFIRELSKQLIQLTRTEIQVAGMVREGRTTKEIAELLCVSENAVLFHRQNIRKKLGLKGKSSSLAAHLQSLDYSARYDVRGDCGSSSSGASCQ